ncbi:hypothetical protein C7S13_8010 [Burkholderia cepacia]|nr:hypothetical protein [Burkholderia cepacia]
MITEDIKKNFDRQTFLMKRQKFDHIKLFELTTTNARV